MENAIKLVLQLSQVKRPHLKPDFLHVSYLSRFPWAYCRRKTTQILSLNLDSFPHLIHTVKKGICIIFLFNGWNKISCITSALDHEYIKKCIYFVFQIHKRSKTADEKINLPKKERVQFSMHSTDHIPKMAGVVWKYYFKGDILTVLLMYLS